MQKSLPYIALVTATLLFCCNAPQQASKYGYPVTTPAEILASPQSFAEYYYGLKLWQDFIPLDTAAQVISKADFLQRVATGGYLPIRLSTKDTVCYQLFACATHPEDLGSIKSLAVEQYHYYQMEGKPLPGLNYTDINGTLFNSQNTAGKMVVWKCWFIHCSACVAEMPALNELTKRYGNRKDVLFISVAFDSAKLLKSFLTTHTFNYAVASVTENYIERDLGITAFPTHIIINKQGLVVKVLDNYKDMEEVLDKEAK